MNNCLVCQKHNVLDESFFGNPENNKKIEYMLSLPYLQRYELFKQKKVTFHELTEISKYRLLYGFEYMDKENKIIVSPKKYFCGTGMWMTEMECLDAKIDWNNTCCNVPTQTAETKIVYENNKRKRVNNDDQNIRDVLDNFHNFMCKKLNRIRKEKQKETKEYL